MQPLVRASTALAGASKMGRRTRALNPTTTHASGQRLFAGPLGTPDVIVEVEPA